MKLSWKQLLIAAGLFLAGYFSFNGSAGAGAGKTQGHHRRGGKNLFYYLPLTIAEQLGYFKDEGLQVEISDFAGGAKALQAVVGGSADVVSGAYEHTINMQAKNQPSSPSCCRAARRRSCWRSTRPCPTTRHRRPEGQEDRRDRAGLLHQHDGQLRAGQGRPEAHRRVLHRRGRRAGAISAIRSGQIDAMANLDPVISMLSRTTRSRPSPTPAP
jgi:NitT/TauT family transport system substrate-binding protein